MQPIFLHSNEARLTPMCPFRASPPEAFQTIASLSVLNILRTIKDRGSVSRTELQTITALSWGTITNTTRELLNRGLIREEGARSTKAGRKPVHLAINPMSHTIIGVDLAYPLVRCQMLNLAGETLGYEELSQMSGDPPDAVLERTCLMIQTMLDSPIMSSRTCLGIGISVPGYLDAARSTMRLPRRMPTWKDVPLRQFIQDRVSPQVRIERDLNCLALAERWFGDAGNAQDVLCLNLGDDVGMGILTGGEVFRGSQQMAGEFGHMTLDPNGPKCACGDHGCVEAYVSAAAVRNHAASVPEKQSHGLSAIFAMREPTIAELSNAASSGDTAARDAFERLGKHLGIGIANLIDLFNPDLIVLAGPLTQAWECFRPTIEAQVEKHASKGSNRQMIISQLGERAMATGACGIVLQSIFEPAPAASNELLEA